MSYSTSAPSAIVDTQAIIVGLMQFLQARNGVISSTTIPQTGVDPSWYIKSITPNHALTSAFFAPTTFDVTLTLSELAAENTGAASLRKGSYNLTDGAILEIDDGGNWTLTEVDQKKRYRGNPDRAFNRYVNASDILEEFIKFVRTLGIEGKSIFDLPINLFIMFLIVEAAKKDQEDYLNEENKLISEASAFSKHSAPVKGQVHRCGYCGRFLARYRAARKLFFCSGAHMDLLDAKQRPVAS